MKLLQNGQPALVDRLAAVGQMQLAAVAQQQGAAQFLFQLTQHFADGGLGHIELLRGAGKTLLAHHLGKVA